MEDLQWMGLQWDAGPGRAQPGEEYHQSRRGSVYARHSATLDARGLTYPCYCTPLELDLSRKAQLAAGRPPRYAGTCRELVARGAGAQERAGHLAHDAVSRAHRPARRIQRHGARRAELRDGRHRRLHPAARRWQRGVLLQQCHRRCGDGHHARAARRRSPHQHAAPVAGARGAGAARADLRASVAAGGRRRFAAVQASRRHQRARVPRTRLSTHGADESPVPARAFEQRERRVARSTPWRAPSP